MAILKIARMGHPILAKRAKEIPDPTTRQIRKLVEDMHETLDDIRGAGLAAPQLHVSKRLVIFAAPKECGEEDEEENAPATDFAPMTEIINPEWQPLSDGDCDGLGRLFVGAEDSQALSPATPIFAIAAILRGAS